MAFCLHPLPDDHRAGERLGEAGMAQEAGHSPPSARALTASRAGLRRATPCRSICRAVCGHAENRVSCMQQQQQRLEQHFTASSSSSSFSHYIAAASSAAAAVMTAAAAAVAAVAAAVAGAAVAVAAAAAAAVARRCRQRTPAHVRSKVAETRQTARRHTGHSGQRPSCRRRVYMACVRAVRAWHMCVRGVRAWRVCVRFVRTSCVACAWRDNGRGS